MKPFTPKRIVWSIIFLVIIAVISIFIFRPKQPKNIQTEMVKRQDLQQTVLATGQVASSLDVNLSFPSSGAVRKINVKEGDHVKSGQVLAILDQATLRANLTSALGTLAQAQANYEKILNGSTNTQIAISEAAVQAARVALDNAERAYNQTKTQQDTIVQNAYKTLLNSGLTATPSISNVNSSNPTISGIYTEKTQGQYKIKLYTAGGLRYSLSGLEMGDGPINTSGPVPLGTHGLYIQFPSNIAGDTDSWTIDIPNTRASTYLTNLNAYQTAQEAESQALVTAQNTIDSAKASLTQAQANLDQVKASATSAEINAARAQVTSAQGQVQAAQAAVNNTMLISPAEGTVTAIDIKVGEQATAFKEVMTLQNVQSLHAEANISEANVAALKPGQSVDYTFDALGPDQHTSGTIETINPASTVVSGVVNYKVTANINNATNIKPGMTANMTVLIDKKPQALAIPARAILDDNGKQYARVIDNPRTKSYHQTEIKTGLQADGGLVEIISGLSEGDEVVTFIQS